MSEEYLILGKTPEGRIFRPSDWPERLCGALAGYNDKGRWEYSEYAQPVIHEGKVAIRVKASLKNIKPQDYRFIMDFAAANRLTVISTGRDAGFEEETAVETGAMRPVWGWILSLWPIQSKIRLSLKNSGLF